jgi:hypothetical protein
MEGNKGVFDLVVQAPSLWPPVRALALAGQAVLARYMLRAEAHGETLPALILAALNQALLDGLNDGPGSSPRSTPRLAFSGGASTDDTVALVLKIPSRGTSGQPGQSSEFSPHSQSLCLKVR